jgi:uncharacterized RDD family membrane protein YckC
VPKVQREALPPHGDEVYRRVTRPDLVATTAAARTMDARAQQALAPSHPGPLADEERTHPGSSSAPTVELKKVPVPAPAASPDSEHDERTVPSQVRADLLKASAEEVALTRPITNPGNLYAAHLEGPTAPDLATASPAGTAAVAKEAAAAPPSKRSAVWSATGPVVEVHARTASLGRRTLAWLVDLSLQAGLVACFLTGLVFSGKLKGVTLTPTSLTGLDAFMLRLHASHSLLTTGGAVIALTAFVYSALFAMLWQGRSPGRRLAGLRLVDERGVAPGPLRALARAGLALVSFALLMGGFWLALFDRRGQTLHDRLTATFLVRPS